MGLASRLKKYLVDQDATAEAEANNREAIEKAEQEAYARAKKRRQKAAEDEAKRRVEEAKQKAIDKARQRGAERAKPIAQKIDERIATARKEAHKAVQTGGQVVKVVGKASATAMDVGGKVAKTAIQTERELVAEVRRTGRTTRRVTPRKVKPRKVAAPQVIVVNAAGEVVSTRKVKQSSKTTVKRPRHTLAQPHYQLASGSGKGYSMGKKSKKLGLY